MGSPLRIAGPRGAGAANTRLRAACVSAQSDVGAERLKLQHKLNVVHWYPVVSLGVAVRF